MTARRAQTDRFDGEGARRDARRLPIGILLAGAATVATLVVPVMAVASTWKFTFATALVYALAALSVNILLGQVGMIALFPAAFMGVGAFVAAAIYLEVGSWPLAFFGAVGVAVILGALVGLPGIRLRGMAFGIVTFAFALAVDSLVFRGGFLGIDPALGATLPRPALGWVDLTHDQTFYFFILAVAVVVWLVVLGHERARPGRAWRAIRDNEVAALSIGVRLGRYKVWAAALAGGVAGVAGVLYLSLLSQANPDPFEPVQSLLIFTAAVTAGTRTVIGAVLAGVLIIVLPELLRTIGVSGRLVPLIFAVGVILSLHGTDGIVGAFSHAAALLRERFVGLLRSAA